MNREHIFNKELAEHIFQDLQQGFDKEYGGFGTSPKHLNSTILRFMLDYHCFFKNEEALEHVNFSLEKMIKSSLYDQLGGGFFQYSKDRKWMSPHFEKRVCDNALLISLLSDTYIITQNKLYEETIHETLDWVNREMTDENGAFYSSLDSDVEGIEGKFYVWDKRAIFSLLGDDAYIFNAYYDITTQGNWEGVNIPRRRITIERLAMSIGWEDLELKRIMEKWKLRLFLERENRIRPSLNEEILLDWNALMCTAYCRAYKATGKEKYKEIAEKNISFIYGKMKVEEIFYHKYINEEAQEDALLDDYASLVEALIELYQISNAKCYLHEAQKITDYLLEHFYKDDSFSFTKEKLSQTIEEKKNMDDHILTFSHSTMIHNLQKMHTLTKKQKYQQIAKEALKRLIPIIKEKTRTFSK